MFLKICNTNYILSHSNFKSFKKFLLKFLKFFSFKIKINLISFGSLINIKLLVNSYYISVYYSVEFEKNSNFLKTIVDKSKLKYVKRVSIDNIRITALHNF